jgi:mono/diheme cytochrome c family protein
MKTIKKLLCAATVIGGAISAGPLLAETKDVFSFIPEGGRSLFANIIASQPPAKELQAMLSAKRTREEWLGFLQDEKKVVPALKSLNDEELLTLADYLSFNMPMDPTDAAKADLAKSLPPDGRDFALEKCQGCHIITVVVTQARSKEAWLGTMNKPSHTRIKLTREQREALASYLVINAGIPTDQIPAELRAGGATY